MKITLVGHFCVDVLHHEDGSEEKKLGGIYHAVAAMANIASDTDTLFPLFGVGRNEIDEIKSVLGEYKNINTGGIFELEGNSNYVHYFDDKPTECVESVSPPIPFNKIKPFLNVDGIYINMVSGRDILLETLDHIRLAVRGKDIPIHLDIHCLTLGINQDGTRFHRAISDWRRWCFMIDSVQMNEEEAESIAMEGYNNEAFAKQMMPLMVKALSITRGENGVTLFRDEHKVLKRNDFNEGKNEYPVSVIGSGDIFGASFLYGYLKAKDFIDASKFAQIVSSYSTKFSLSAKHRELQEMRKMI